MKIISRIVSVVYSFLYFTYVTFFLTVLHLDQYHFAFEIIEDNPVFVYNVKYFRGIIFRFVAVFYRYVFEVTYGI